MSPTMFCPRMREEGSCQEARCEFNHSFLACDPCGFMCTTAQELEAHNATDIHLRKIAGQSLIFLCPVCQRRSNGQTGWRVHSRSWKHQRACLAQGIAPLSVEPEEMAEVPGHTFCVACNVHIQTKYWERHLKNIKHLEKERYASFKVVLDDSEKDKNSIALNGDLDFGIVAPHQASTGAILKQLTITTTDPTARISLVDAHLASSKDTTPGHSSFTLSRIRANRSITASSPLPISVILRQDYGGRCQDRVEFVFEDLNLRTRFVITRPVLAIIGDKADYEKLQPTIPYVPRPRTTRQPETAIVEGERPPAMGAVPYVVTLPKADIPRNLTTTLSKGNVGQVLANVKSIFMPRDFNSQTYSRHFKYLAWIEEYRAEQDLSIYDMSDTTLSRYNKFFILEVPGLAEKRPSVLIGDRILVQAKGSQTGHWFEGRVHFVRQREVGLVFHRTFAGWTPAKQYNVRFKLNRYPIRRQHLAMDSAFTEERVLFPSPRDLPALPCPRPATYRLRIFNPLIEGNPAQLQAVVSIAKLRPGAPPFVIFGPPGTGKTVTAVEAIRQVLVQSPTAKVLACAPSNSAADILALRLRDLGADVVFRFYAPSRNKDDVPLELRDYTYMRTNPNVRDEAPCFSVPPLARMKRFRVVVTTCLSSSVTSGIGIPRGHFSHIFVDEAGQASEPEVMIAIRTMANSNTNVILSGDPKQLGPIIRSPIARQLGLEKSYLERLMEREIYNIKDHYGKTVVKLVKNFRSHSAILKFPNERFYENELEQCADRKLINFFLNSTYLPNKNFPIVFHGIRGKDDREAYSPSFFNIEEVLQVKRYVQALRFDRRFRTTDNDIGIISPYNAQCRKIEKALSGVADVKIGSVEEFQGQERKIIIISTVRSSTEFIEYDLKHTLGFVASPRRFNVAVTRAQALLIIVGDPTVLSLDPLWRSFLNYIHRNGGWTGAPITWDPTTAVDSAGGYDRRVRDVAKIDMNDFTRRMETLTLETVEAAEGDNNVDRPWRDVE